jgi:hypothetical protein
MPPIRIVKQPSPHTGYLIGGMQVPDNEALTQILLHEGKSQQIIQNAIRALDRMEIKSITIINGDILEHLE